MSMKLLVINNLSAGLGEGAIYDFIRSFVDGGDEICIRSTKGDHEISDMLKDAHSFDAVVASGGDGTIATIGYTLRYSGIPILPFPAGTANLLSLNLASPNEPHALSKMLRTGRTLDFDMGEIEVGSQKRGFCLMAGAGYDATIMHDAQSAKKLLGSMAYFSAAFSNPLPQNSRFTLVLDGKTVESEGLGILVVNFSKLQFDISVTHENNPRDGIFDVVILKAKTAFDLIPALFAGILDREGAFPGRSDALQVLQASEVHALATPSMEVQYDGETTEMSTPFQARVLPLAVKFFVSEEGLELFS
jgi:diacylglycerol kinase family enzyme